MKSNLVNALLVIIYSLFFFAANAQDSLHKDKKVVVSGMMLVRYTSAFDKNIDINGKYHAVPGDYATSAFSLRRARVQAKSQITPRAEAAVLLNLTDFIGNPANKVLELATIKYKFSDYLNLQVGQFRPYFGREDLYPEELLQSLEWTNQYYAFGANGWQSFQLGATVFGSAKVANIPVKYYLGVFNGNGRNQLTDNDNGKLFPARVELGIRPKTKLGLNGGLGKSKGEKVWALNADIDHVTQLGGPWELEVQSEYKRGTNNSSFDTSAVDHKLMQNYMLSGYYVLPNLKYKINSAHVKSLELSTRYEFINYDEKRDNCKKTTCMPMLSCQLADEYFLRFELGMIFDKYAEKNLAVPDHNASRFVFQVQARF
jgi:phosphate-selective porin O/P